MCIPFSRLCRLALLRRSLSMLTSLTYSLELTIWFVPSIIQNAIAVRRLSQGTLPRKADHKQSCRYLSSVSCWGPCFPSSSPTQAASCPIGCSRPVSDGSLVLASAARLSCHLSLVSWRRGLESSRCSLCELLLDSCQAFDLLPFLLQPLPPTQRMKLMLRSFFPRMVSMMGGMILMWLCVPKVNRRID
jgi:hypothetical protein